MLLGEYQDMKGFTHELMGDRLIKTIVNRKYIKIKIQIWQMQQEYKEWLVIFSALNVQKFSKTRNNNHSH